MIIYELFKEVKLMAQQFEQSNYKNIIVMTGEMECQQ